MSSNSGTTTYVDFFKMQNQGALRELFGEMTDETAPMFNIIATLWSQLFNETYDYQGFDFLGNLIGMMGGIDESSGKEPISLYKYLNEHKQWQDSDYNRLQRKFQFNGQNADQMAIALLKFSHTYGPDFTPVASSVASGAAISPATTPAASVHSEG